MHILYVVMHNRESICLILYCFLKGDVILPNREEMWKDVTTKLDAMRKRYVNRPRHTIQVDYIDYMDELSKLNGNYPHLGINYFCSNDIIALSLPQTNKITVIVKGYVSNYEVLLR